MCKCVRQEQVNGRPYHTLMYTSQDLFDIRGEKANNIIFTTTLSERGRRFFLITPVCDICLEN